MFEGLFSRTKPEKEPAERKLERGSKDALMEKKASMEKKSLMKARKGFARLNSGAEAGFKEKFAAKAGLKEKFAAKGAFKEKFATKAAAMRKPGKAGLTRGGTAGDWPRGSECSSYIDQGGGSMSSSAMSRWSAMNDSLVSYLYPAVAPPSVEAGWRALMPGCRIVPSGCWCFHVAGSMVKADNPRGHERCAPKDAMMNCASPSAGPFYMKARRNCSCFAQRPAAPPCLFGDMRPAKLLAIIAASRAAGVTHIIEQGRYGGLSAYIYALHGERDPLMSA